MERHLIITADDFGYSTERNVGIVQCHSKRAVTRSSLLVNGLAAQEAASMAKECEIPLGLHWNITEGHPECDPSEVHSLLTDGGEFLGKMGFREALKLGLVLHQEVQKELEAQIKRFHKLLGHMPEYVDGHQHIHVLPGVCEVFAKVLKAAGISSTRVPHELGLEPEDSLWVDEGWLSFYKEVSEQAQRAAHIFNNHNIRFASGFVGMRTMGGNMTVSRLETCLLTTFASLEREPAWTERSAGCTVAYTGKHDGVTLTQPTDCDTISRGRSDSDGRTSEPLLKTAIEDYIPLESEKNGAVPLFSAVALNPVMGTERVAVTVELMVHPGYPCCETSGGCGVGPDDFAQSRDRQHEMDILCSDSLRLFAQKHRMKLVANIEWSNNT